MNIGMTIALGALAALSPASALAQNQITARARTSECVAENRTTARTAGQPSSVGRDYDIVLEVPNLCVERINLIVRGLEAHVALNAAVASLVTVTAGADVAIKTVDLTIQGVRAEALLLVDLDNVRYIVDRALQLIDNNPQIFDQLYRTTGGLVGTVGGLANTALQPGGVLSQTVNTLGQTVHRTLDTTGRIVERTLDTGGRLLSENVVGSVRDLQLIRETAGTAGQLVRQVRDASGSVIEYTVDQAGTISNARVLQRPTGR